MNLKKIIKNIKANKNKGQVALFISISIMAILIYIGLYVSNKSVKQHQVISDVSESIEAFYASDTGAERFMYELRLDIEGVDGRVYNSLYETADKIDGTIDSVNSPIDMVDGRLYVLSVPGGVGGTEVISVGSYKDVNRAIELNYEP